MSFSAGRQGDPGSSRFFVSLDDDLFIKYRLRDLIKINKRDLINKNQIVLIGVANVSFWHGYDRIIKGLKNYALTF